MTKAASVTPNIRRDLDPMTRAYLECALWSSMDDDDRPLDENYSIDDLDDDAIGAAVRLCAKFKADNAADIGFEMERAGHDLWLTRNGHGAGFWDGDWPEEAGGRLDKAATALGESDLYVGDDGFLYFT